MNNLLLTAGKNFNSNNHSQFDMHKAASLDVDNKHKLLQAVTRAWCFELFGIRVNPTDDLNHVKHMWGDLTLDENIVVQHHGGLEHVHLILGLHNYKKIGIFQNKFAIIYLLTASHYMMKLLQTYKYRFRIFSRRFIYHNKWNHMMKYGSNLFQFTNSIYICTHCLIALSKNSKCIKVFNANL